MIIGMNESNHRQERRRRQAAFVYFNTLFPNLCLQVRFFL